MVPPPAGLNNAIPQSHFPAHSNARPVDAGNGSAAFKQDNPQSHPSVYNNVGPVPAGNGSQGLSSQVNHQFGPNSGAMPAQESYVGRKNNVNTPHRGHQVGQNNHMANLNNSNMGPPRGDNNLAQNNSTGVPGHSNAAAPTPSNAGTTLQAYFNPVTGQTMRLDGTIWTPHESKKDRYADHSVYNQSEPRNFAPRPMGIPVMFPPPPNFTSGPGSSSQIGDIITNQAFTDPFTSPDSSASNAVNEAAYFLANSHEIDYSELTEAEQELEVQWGLLRDKLSELRTMGSNALRRLINGVNGIPTTPVLLNVMNFPFIESSSQSMPAVWGVIKISNIPFGTMRAEVIAMLGRNSKIITDAQEGVHIIMERVTSKTGDAFVEFSSIHAATRTVERHHEAIRKHRQPRLGDRPIKMTMSSQKELMEALFPLCRGVNFDHGCVTLLPEDPENPWNTFRGFVMAEELNLLIKHIEVPSRSPYSKDCPQRPFESMISTLKKLPWYASHLITLEQRQIIYDATFRLIEFLGELLQKGDGTPGKHRQQTVLNEQLYKRLVHAAMLCPGFSVLQKDNIAYLANMSGPAIAEFNMPPFSECWAHLYNLCPRPGVPVDVLEWYITLIREETVRYVDTLPASVQASIKERAKEDSLYFGYMWHEIQLPQGRELAAMTLRDVAEKELDAIKRILDRAAANTHAPLVTDAADQHPGHYIVI
ncbi:uncharacterized protein PODANS_1_20950 [Podospora anserina S mat+]|uniref:Podospora anserina S mat+ genomic DNA chromosome 1, supercontig 5 n=1 Tax=Podospora anserina (strain S / ATCC MYA-4624 / DSM 980 / FGSC 10383) TaxID=515849 RepID=B2ABF8_PODAN|nr:uncharacterized protein PODANS_1_20950 [Podospora anserina S mat+]CAP60824.1 unnamed protein product [Podospora anserina S mat+]CDP24487.1 Putative protein of unknown function [Podospora anserina S mat+]